MRFNCVLLVDDDRVNNFLTQKVISGMGVASMIATASDGKKGLDYIRHECTDEVESCPDLILLDVNMPLMNGMEFMERYNEIPKKKNSIVVVLSSTELPDDFKKRLQEAHVTEFLVKPFTAEKLNAIVNKYKSTTEV